MRVIESGRSGGAWTKEYVCTGKGKGYNGCNARLEVEGTDLFHTCSFAMGECSDYITFECPECKEWTNIPPSDLPYGLACIIFRMDTRVRNRDNVSSDPI
jgi:hypothetical protein